MRETSERVNQERKFRDFWDRKAKKYPLPFDDSAFNNTQKVLNILGQRCIDFSGRKVLDIGCGTGIFTLPLAKIAQFVVGLDFSHEMLERLKRESERFNIKNIGIIHTSWKDFDPYQNNLIRSFDIVLSSMSMAIKEEADLLKMETCSRQYCIYIGWGRLRKNPFMEEIFAKHEMPFKPPPGAHAIYEILSSKQRQLSIDYVHTSWQWEGTIEEAISDIAMHIDVQGGVPDPEIIRDVVTKNSHDGRILHTTEAEQGVIIWQVP